MSCLCIGVCLNVCSGANSRITIVQTGATRRQLIYCLVETRLVPGLLECRSQDRTRHVEQNLTRTGTHGLCNYVHFNLGSNGGSNSPIANGLSRALKQTLIMQINSYRVRALAFSMQKRKRHPSIECIWRDWKWKAFARESFYGPLWYNPYSINNWFQFVDSIPQPSVCPFRQWSMLVIALATIIVSDFQL